MLFRSSELSQRRIEFSLPYAPDDIFYKIGPNDYGSQASDAPDKAKNYGRTQNQLLLGNRNGMNVQTAPEFAPDAPFDPIIITANGLSGLYRMNGTSWQMDANGILLSSDLLFWGAVGGTGNFWFPVAPGITTLPTTPPIVNGQMTVTNVVPAFNETVLLTSTTHTRLAINNIPYSLNLSQSIALTTFTGAVITTTETIAIPIASININSIAPRVSSGVIVTVPSAAVNKIGRAHV